MTPSLPLWPEDTASSKTEKREDLHLDEASSRFLKNICEKFENKEEPFKSRSTLSSISKIILEDGSVDFLNKLKQFWDSKSGISEIRKKADRDRSATSTILIQGLIRNIFFVEPVLTIGGATKMIPRWSPSLYSLSDPRYCDYDTCVEIYHKLVDDIFDFNEKESANLHNILSLIKNCNAVPYELPLDYIEADNKMHRPNNMYWFADEETELFYKLRTYAFAIDSDYKTKNSHWEHALILLESHINDQTSIHGDKLDTIKEEIEKEKIINPKIEEDEDVKKAIKSAEDILTALDSALEQLKSIKNYRAVFLNIAAGKIFVKSYQTDRSQTGEFKTNREKRWEAKTHSPQFALRRDCLQIERKLIDQIINFEGYPQEDLVILRDLDLIGKSEKTVCPITLEAFDFNSFVHMAFSPVHGKSNYQVGHLNPIKINNDTPGKHIGKNISWISGDGNRMQGNLTVLETHQIITEIANRLKN